LRALVASVSRGRPALIAGLSALSLVLVACSSATSTVGVASPHSTQPQVRSTSPMTSGPTCRPSQFRWALAHDGAQGAIVLDAHPQWVAGARCQVDQPVKVWLTDINGRALTGVSPDPTTVRVHELLTPHKDPQGQALLLAWRNWCHAAPSSFRFVIETAGQRHHISWSSSTPSCIDQSQGSTLRPFTETG
jgi:hypothetical protein